MLNSDRLNVGEFSCWTNKVAAEAGSRMERASDRNYAASFLEFLGMLPGAESLDDPAVLPQGAGVLHADYLLFQRSVIAEVKTLESNPDDKVQGVVDKYRSHPEFPLFHGSRTLNAILEHLPEDVQQEMREEVYLVSTQALCKACEKANRQIRQTRKHFALSSAAGVVFILNDDVPILSPNVLAARVSQQMRKRTAAGHDRFEEIAFACVITWAHVINTSAGVSAHPVLIIDGPAAGSHSIASGQLDYLLRAWSEKEDSTLLRSGDESLEEYMLTVPQGKDEDPTRVRRQDLWRKEYMSNRYLGRLDISQLMDHGAKLFEETRPYFFGQRPVPSRGTIAEQMRRITHFFEECELRNLDMRLFAQRIRQESHDKSQVEDEN